MLYKSVASSRYCLFYETAPSPLLGLLFKYIRYKGQAKVVIEEAEEIPSNCTAQSMNRAIVKNKLGFSCLEMIAFYER